MAVASNQRRSDDQTEYRATVIAAAALHLATVCGALPPVFNACVPTRTEAMRRPVPRIRGSGVFCGAIVTPWVPIP
jgi:hypothetical protein